MVQALSGDDCVRQRRICHNIPPYRAGGGGRGSHLIATCQRRRWLNLLVCRCRARTRARRERGQLYFSCAVDCLRAFIWPCLFGGIGQSQKTSSEMLVCRSNCESKISRSPNSQSIRLTFIFV